MFRYLAKFLNILENFIFFLCLHLKRDTYDSYNLIVLFLVDFCILLCTFIYHSENN